MGREREKIGRICPIII